MDNGQVVSLGSDDPWPPAVSDGLSIPCADCGEISLFDYLVDDDFWRCYVPEKPARFGVVCLPCLDRRCGGIGLVAALRSVQWTGTGHTVVLVPIARYFHGRIPEAVITMGAAPGGGAVKAEPVDQGPSSSSGGGQ